MSAKGLVQVGQRAPAGVLDPRRPLVVVTWNVHKGLDPGLALELAALARDEAVDVFALQEARPGLPLPDGFAGHHAESYRSFGSGVAEGVSTVARADPLEALRMRSPRRELLMLTPKAALISRFVTLEGEPLTVVNVHGLNFDPAGRLLEGQLTDLAQRASAFDGPMILAGDFNTWNEARMRAVRELAAKLDLVEAEPPSSGGRTGGLGNPSVERALGLDRRMHLDRAFVRGFLPVEAKWLDRCRASDHVPLLIKLAWK
ncbi:MAG: endonuclease/exonuclease/phosphatase family protein [Planctomycetota bacterium]